MNSFTDAVLHAIGLFQEPKDFGSKTKRDRTKEKKLRYGNRGEKK